MPNTTTARYATAGYDRSRVVCRDCSTRATAVTIPADEVDAHDAWHLEAYPDARPLCAADRCIATAAPGDTLCPLDRAAVEALGR